jgi:hypothetical protein
MFWYSPFHPDWLWSPTTIPNGYRGLRRSLGWPLTICLVQRIITCDSIHHFPHASLLHALSKEWRWHNLLTGKQESTWLPRNAAPYYVITTTGVLQHLKVSHTHAHARTHTRTHTHTRARARARTRRSHAIQTRQCTCNVIFRRVCATIVAVEKQCRVCVCSLSYPACNSHAPYCYMWVACPAVHYFSKTTRLEGKKVIEPKMRVLISSTTFLWNISHSKMNRATHHKRTQVVM